MDRTASGGGTSGLTGILDQLEETGGETVSIGDVLEAFRHRSLGALVTLFGTIASLPVVGGIPGVSILTGTLILVVIGQALRGGGSLWLPAVMRRREIGHDTLEAGIAAVRPSFRWIDRHTRPRLRMLSEGWLQRWAIVAMIALLALSFYPLAFVPGAVTPSAFAVVALGLALMLGDGVLALLGYLLAGATAYLVLVAV